MKIQIINGQEIKFNNSFLPSTTKKRDSHTSYLNEFRIKNNSIKLNSDFLFRLICYHNLKNYIKDSYKSNLDLFGGVGITAKLFCVDENQCVVNDIDKNCFEILKQNFNIVTSIDVTKEKINQNYDLILCDFNDFTIKKATEKYKTTLENIFNHSKKYVVINDCSGFYLKYGKTAYEKYSSILKCKCENKLEFFRCENKFFSKKFPEWGLKRIEYFINSAFLLFEKNYKDEYLVNQVLSNKQEIIKCFL